jgi:peptidoglycan hydrolase-like protein with peptidoglycan-binding domain
MLGMEEKNQTGLFGDITKNKVIEFQKTHKDDKGNKLKPDGIVGHKTYGSLKSS